MKPLLNQSSRRRKSGFTLVEIMVILAIAAVVSSITFGAFKSISEGNRRTTCQSNMAQIYQSCRQYSQDFDGRFPYLNRGTVTNSVADHNATPEGGLGLWALYSLPGNRLSTGSTNCATPSVDLPVQSQGSLAGYVRSNRVFHCPEDDYEKNVQYGDTCAVKTVNSGIFSFEDTNRVYLNPTYLSYQADDEGVETYQSVRAKDPNLGDTNPVPIRQLLPFVVVDAPKIPGPGTQPTVQTPERPMRDMTVVTWCRFHRKLDKNSVTQPGRRNYDNVLFSDGSVQNLPMEQNVSETGGATGVCKGWQRVPRNKAENMSSAANCIPAP